MGWGIWNKIKQGVSKAYNWVKDNVIKPGVQFTKDIVAPILSANGQVKNVVGNVLGKVLPGPLGQFASTAGKAWGTVGNIAERFSKS